MTRSLDKLKYLKSKGKCDYKCKNCGKPLDKKQNKSQLCSVCWNVKRAKEVKKERGKKNRASGAAFERKVRNDLESKGWIVIKNPNNVIDDKFKQGKSKYNPFTKSLMMNSGGFPDFIAFITFGGTNILHTELGEIEGFHCIIGIECKSNGYLSKKEKEKCQWLLSNNIFSKIYVAFKGKKRGEICYKEITIDL